MNTISNEEFLKKLGEGTREGEYLWTCSGSGDPGDSNFRWSGLARDPSGGPVPNNLDIKPNVDHNTYYAVSSFKKSEDGKISRKREHFARMLCLVVDDVNIDQICEDDFTYILKTSPGKMQAGIFLDSLNDPDCQNAALCAELLREMTSRGLIGDRGGNNYIRYVRLMRGMNQKPRESGHFKHELIKLDESFDRVSLHMAAACIGIDLDEIKERLNRVETYAKENNLSNYEASKSLSPETHKAQADKVKELTDRILAGTELHDSINQLAASLIASGTSSGAAINMIRAIMERSNAARDERWRSRYDDIPRAVKTAEDKYAGKVSKKAEAAPVKRDIKILDAFDHFSDQSQANKGPRWLVKGLLELDAISMIFGAPGDGKSFLAIDIACSVATGRPWQGNKAKKLPVVYFAGEGQGGIMRRVAAWKMENGTEIEKGKLFVTNTVDFLEFDQLKNVIEQIENTCTEKPGLVVIDTLARAFASGDENSSQDVGRFIAHVDELIKNRWGCNVMIIHHAGKDAAKGARGSSALKAALDQEFQVTKAIETRELKCTKMKDAEIPEKMFFELKKVILGHEDDGFGEVEEVSSAVVQMIEKDDAAINIRKKDTEAPELTLDTFREYCEEFQDSINVKEIRKYFACTDHAAYTILKRAEESKIIEVTGAKRNRRYTLCEKTYIF